MTNLRLYLILGLALAVVLVDSVSRFMSMCADLVLIGAIVALVWGPLMSSKGSTEKK